MNQFEFGEYFKKHRIKSGYSSQRKLALDSGISNGTIARIESGTQKVSIDTIRVLSKYLKSTTYGDLLEKLEYFDGLSEEKKEQLKESYDDRFRFTEEFRNLIHKLAPTGFFSEEIVSDIKKRLEGYVDDDFKYTPKELIELMYEIGDASDMLDFYEIFKDIAKRHNLLPFITQDEEELKAEKQLREMSKEISELFIKRGIVTRFDQDQYIKDRIGELNTKNMKKLIQLLKMETAELEYLDFDGNFENGKSLEIITFFKMKVLHFVTVVAY